MEQYPLPPSLTGNAVLLHTKLELEKYLNMAFLIRTIFVIFIELVIVNLSVTLFSVKYIFVSYVNNDCLKFYSALVLKSFY